MNLIKRIVIFSCLFIFLAGIIVSEDPVKTLWSISSFGKDDFFHEPSDIEVDLHRSRIYIADSGNHRVLVFDFQGKLLKIIGRKGQGPAEFSKPTGLCILKDGGLAVADFGNSRIQILDGDGKFIKSISTKGFRVADLIFIDNKIYTVSTFGSSNYSLDMSSEKDNQPLINILDNQGSLIQSISVNNYPEIHPFLRAIKHRVCLAVAKEGKLYVPHFAINVIHVFDWAGKKIGQFDRPLPFKPDAPKIVQETHGKDGIYEAQATLDFITQDARIGPDGNLYLLTFTESSIDRAKRKNKGINLPPHPERIDVIDTKTHQVIRQIGIDGDTKAFAFMNENHLVYIYIDSEGEIILKCIQY